MPSLASAQPAAQPHLRVRGDRAGRLLFYAVVVYGLMWEQANANLDVLLDGDRELAERVLMCSLDGTLSMPVQRGARSALIGEALDRHGVVLWTSPACGPALTQLLSPPGVPVVAERIRAIRVPDGRRFRVLDSAWDSPPEVVVRVARDESRKDREVRRLLVMELGSAPLVLLLAGLVRRAMAVRALAPVGRMVDEAPHIVADRLRRRLYVLNSEDELVHLALVLGDAFARLERFTEEPSRFASDASHELRTPPADLPIGRRSPARRAS